MNRLLPMLFLSSLLFVGPAEAAPRVVASVKPVHALVASVMQGVGEPELIVRGAASPHTYALRPSDAAALEDADIVFWTGHGLELFLEDALDTLASGAISVELADAEGLALLPLREGGAFEAHADEEAGHDHDHGHAEASDMHFWLDPENAKVMVSKIAAVLSENDPANATAYLANAEAERLRLDALEEDLHQVLAPVEDRPFIVFHDAYQYFEHRFGLTAAGSITVSPEVMPGAARIEDLRAKVGALGAACVFAEPNFEPSIIKAIVEGTSARIGTLDPEGSALVEGAGLYAELLRGLAESMVDCLI